MIKLTIAQLNLTVGDVAGNVARMVAAVRQAVEEGAQLVVFPELAVSGYYPGDLLDDPAFLRQVEAGLQSLREASRELPGLAWAFGAPLTREGPGKKLERKATEACMTALRATIARMIQRSEYKRRQAPPLIRLRGRAFGQGRQMPIAAVFPGAHT